jgi:hypothetical protein
VVERRVLARLEVSGSNLDLCKCAYFIKKIYLGSTGVVAGWSGYFFILLFLIFLIFSIFRIDL